MKPKVIILFADGTNCDQELKFAFELAGAEAEVVHVNKLRNKEKKLTDYQILAFPGGFSYGDDIASGKIFAAELTSFFLEDLQKFVDKKNTATIGICNGFQALIRTGILPFGNLGTMDATLAHNDSGHFECRWTQVITQKSNCVFLPENKNPLWIAVNHGEGKLFGSEQTIKKIEEKNLVVFRYVDETGKPTQHYPQNPNGSANAIAGITDPTGRVLGLMPHPEKFVLKTQYPNWRRSFDSAQDLRPHGLRLFENMVSFAKNS